jgi:preprotein translocase subunit SecA
VEAVREEAQTQPTKMKEERRQIPMANMTPSTGPGEVDGRSAPPAEGQEVAAIEQARSDKVPRNAPCPCGSGKKYKQCHGRPGAAALS